MTSAQIYPGMPGFSASTRPMTDSEKKAAMGTLKPLRNNARGMAVFSIVMALMINFVSDPIAMMVPIFFGVASLGMAIQARKGAGRVGKMLATGTVTDVRIVPKRMSVGRGWELGMFYAAKSRVLSGMLVEGVPASLTVLPETKHLLAVNGTPLRLPVQLTSVPGAVMPVAPPAVSRAPTAAPMPVDEGLPPPPDDWAGRSCSKCGHNNVSDAAFCEKCGLRL
jgi:hypothetical protein